jgi:hypothetical protein
MERLQEEVIRAERYEAPLGVVLGAAHGVRLEGSAAPRQRVPHEWVVDGIVQCKRRSDIAGRYGDAGFMILLPQTGADGAAAFCRRLKQAQLDSFNQGESAIRLHLGAAARTPSQRTAKSLLRRAEEEWDIDRAEASYVGA